MKNQPQEIHSIGAVARMREQAMGNGSVHDANAHPLGGGDGQLAVDAKAQAALIWACMKKRAAQMGMRLRLADGRVITPELSPEEVELEDDAAKAKPFGSAARKLPAEFERTSAGLKVTVLPDRDGWAAQTGFVDGFPVGQDPQAGKAWLAHCYGMLGAGRSNEEDSSIGAELYVVTGQSPRQLDRNITLVGRVLKGMELLSATPRGPAPMGFYTDPTLRTPIVSIRRASDVPAAERTPIQVLRTDSKTFADTVEARRNRVDDFYKRPAGHIDLCNIPVPVR